METAKVYVWKEDGKWCVGTAATLIDGSQYVFVKQTKDTWREAMEWIAENYVTEAP
jgi:hypothetical protein